MTDHGSGHSTPTPRGHHGRDDADAAVLAALRAAAMRHDPVPDGLVERVQFAVAWTEVQAEIAALVEHCGHRVAGVRGDTTQSRTLTFSGTYASMTVMIDHQRSRRRLDGWLSDVDEPVIVRLRHLGDSQDATVSDHGRFEFPDVAPGAVQLVVMGADDGEARLVTPTIQI